MIRAVFCDFYGTLVRFDPPAEMIQASALRGLGLSVEPDLLRRAYVYADDYMARENGRDPVLHRPAHERDAFFAEYERVLLQAAGVSADAALAAAAWRRVSQVPRDLALYDDVLPALATLKGQGLVVGVISNLERDMGELARRLGLRPFLDFWVTSQEVGHQKPHPTIFRAALQKAGVGPPEALHVGDQLHSDVEGARAVGMYGVLLDRTGEWSGVGEVARLSSLLGVLSHVQALNAATRAAEAGRKR